jgi:hypothetical protein
VLSLVQSGQIRFGELLNLAQRSGHSTSPYMGGRVDVPCVPNVPYDLDCPDIGFTVYLDPGYDPYRFNSETTTVWAVSLISHRTNHRTAQCTIGIHQT